MEALKACKRPLPTPDLTGNEVTVPEYSPTACWWPVHSPEGAGWSWSVRAARWVEKFGRDVGGPELTLRKQFAEWARNSLGSEHRWVSPMQEAVAAHFRGDKAPQPE